MLIRAVIVWLGLVVLAVLNGVTRNTLLTHRLGEQSGHVISTLTLTAVIFLVAWLSTPWIGPANAGEAVTIGLIWVLLTMAFEFLAGHYLFGHSWEKLRADYNVARGRVWALVLLASLLAPVWAERMRG